MRFRRLSRWGRWCRSKPDRWKKPESETLALGFVLHRNLFAGGNLIMRLHTLLLVFLIVPARMVYSQAGRATWIFRPSRFHRNASQRELSISFSTALNRNARLPRSS